MADRKKVIKGLECCMKWTGEPNTATCHCSDCSYTNMDILGERCLIDLINDALALLKEQTQIVRCKDCKYWSAERINDFNKCRRWINVGVKNFATIGEWFCADGEQK